jgi:transposase
MLLPVAKTPTSLPSIIVSKHTAGGKLAMIAVGDTILVIIYQMLNHHVTYQELGGNYFDEHDRMAVEKRLVRRLEKLGYQVSLESATQVA